MWLINKKMYKETFLITNIYLAVLHVVYLILRNHPNIFEIYLYSFMMVHILFSFIINNMYYRKLEIIFHKMPLSLYQEHHFKENELLIIGVPAYGGRVPAPVVDALRHFTGSNTPVVLVATYGNRDIDDTLIELKKNVIDKGFIPTQEKGLGCSDYNGQGK